MPGTFSQLLPALNLSTQLEPYKKLLGVLVRQNCISIAVSNPYLNLAEPLGAVMLREGRLPARSFQRLVSGEQQQLAGYVMAYEVPDDAMQQQTLQGVHNVLTQQQVPQQQLAHVQITQQQESAAAQVQAALQAVRPGLMGGWYGPWSAKVVGASCRLQPPAGPAAAAPSSAQQQQQQQQQQQPPAQGAGVADVQQPTAETASQAAAVAGQQAQQQPVCSLGQQFLQSYLDSLGSLNTFG